MERLPRTCPVIAGPTGVGKTGLITRLAAEHPIEVISLDSRQIYRGLRIGTAQPTDAELSVCPHHLIDFLSPDDTYDAMRFRGDFERVFVEICRRGGVPILVGGAGLYLTALVEGFLEIPGNDAEKLAAIRSELERLDDGEIRSRLAAVDPESIRRLHRNDRVRLQRALEIFRLAGRPLTELLDEQEARPSLGLAFPVHVLERPVAELDRRIEQRTRSMLDAGWIEETETLLAVHGPDSPGLGSIGYREIVAVLQGRQPRGELAAAIVRVTRQYAKRQRTWFRKVDAAARCAPGDPALPGLIVGSIDRRTT